MVGRPDNVRNILSLSQRGAGMVVVWRFDGSFSSFRVREVGRSNAPRL